MVVDDRLYKYTGVYWLCDDSKKSTLLHLFISTKFYKHIVKYSMIQKANIFEEYKKQEHKIKRQKFKVNNRN